jgi:hypothetical protein
MADDTYSEFKEEQKAVTVLPVTGGRVFRYRFRPQPPSPTYSEFKATVETALQSAVETIKQEMAAQHDQTRAEVRASRKDVLAAIKESPVEYVKILAEFGATFLIFCLALHLLLKIDIVNPTFAVIMLIACGVYWGMARIKERGASSEKHAE